MKRMILILCLGLVGGGAAHQAYFKMHRPCVEPTLACELAWIRHELDLTPGQYRRLTRIHERSEPQLAALADQLDAMRRQFAEFEAQRRGTGEIDFLEFGEFIAQRREIKDECTSSTRLLIMASAELMDPEQRRRYLALVGQPRETSRNQPL